VLFRSFTPVLIEADPLSSLLPPCEKYQTAVEVAMMNYAHPIIKADIQKAPNK